MITYMSKIEDILYAAYGHGQRDALLKKANEIRKAEQKKYIDQGDLYELAFKALIKEGKIPEGTMW